MIKLRNNRLAALTVLAGLGIGAVATPAIAVAASQPSHATVVKIDPRSPDSPGTKDGSRHDRSIDKAAKLDKGTSVDKRTSVDRKTDR